jgi:hypothetical protein
MWRAGTMYSRPDDDDDEDEDEEEDKDNPAHVTWLV